MAGNGDGRAVSVVGLYVSVPADTPVIGSIGVSVRCRGSSVAWAGAGGNSFGIDVVAVSLGDMTDEGLPGMDVGVTGVSIVGASEVMRSADGAA